MLELTLGAIHNYDRTGPLLDGSVKPEGIEFRTETLGPVELFRRMAQDAAFDVAEMSSSTYFGLRSRGDDRFVALPIFPSRSFRHSSIVVNRNAGIRRPADLAGRRVGMSEYQMTAALWIRGMLEDDYGVAPESVEWFEGGLDEFEPERVEMPLPDRFSIQRIPDNQTLSDLLEAGEIDALMDARLPGCFQRGAPTVQRLFGDYRDVERNYFVRTGFLPIMHLVVVRASLYEREPWIAESIYAAFSRALEAGIERIRRIWALACVLPWLAYDVEESEQLGLTDCWRYGVAANRRTLDYMLDQSHRQGLSERRLQIEEVFAEELLEK